MSTNRPITTSFPLGLFCTATLTTPSPKPVRPAPAESPLDWEKIEELIHPVGRDAWAEANAQNEIVI
jgi:hypothetical protein